MKVAVTADVHLSTGDAHPERYRALEDVFRRTDKAGIEHLIIAGDLFNEDSHNYSEFEGLCRDHPPLKYTSSPVIMIRASARRTSLRPTFTFTQNLKFWS